MWKKVPSYDNYMVNEKGEVLNRSTFRKCTLQEKHGYFYACIRVNDKYKLVAVHRMVCEAFHGTAPSINHQVDHINRDRGDNRPCNLEWVSPSTNIRRAKSKTVRGTAEDGSYIEFSHLAMAAEFGFNVNAISKALHKRANGISQGFHWEYVTG